MIRITIKQLFRRCLLIGLIGLAAGCSSFKQMPSDVPVVEYRSKAVEVKQQEPTQPIASKVSDNNFALEATTQESALIEDIASKFSIPAPLAAEIITLATKNAYEDFPKRNDILAIIAVESSYRVKALLQGCYGLMQVQAKSHRKKIAGRNIYNPAVNIEVGAAILHEYYLFFNKDKRLAVLAYNAGNGNVLRGHYKSIYHTKYAKQLTFLPRT